MRWHKYGAKKTFYDGITFDSKAEAEYYAFLKNSKEHEIIEMQPKIYLTKAKILYKPDFKVKKGSYLYYVDIKGFATPVFNIKKRLWKAYMNLPLHIIKKKGSKFITSEVLCE